MASSHGSGRELLEAEGNALFVLVELEDLDLNMVANINEIAGMGQAAPAHIGDMKESVDAAHVNESAVVGEVLNAAGEDRTLFQMLKRLGALLGDFLFEELLARDDNVAALLVQLDDADFDLGTLHAVEIADGTKVNLRGRAGMRVRRECQP